MVTDLFILSRPSTDSMPALSLIFFTSFSSLLVNSRRL